MRHRIVTNLQARRDAGRFVSVIDMWHRHHPEACRDCREWGTWEPGTDFGVLVSDGPRLVERSAIVARLLVP